jgi:hypothetical protein
MPALAHAMSSCMNWTRNSLSLRTGNLATELTLKLELVCFVLTRCFSRTSPTKTQSTHEIRQKKLQIICKLLAALTFRRRYIRNSIAVLEGTAGKKLSDFFNGELTKAGQRGESNVATKVASVFVQRLTSILEPHRVLLCLESNNVGAKAYEELASMVNRAAAEAAGEDIKYFPNVLPSPDQFRGMKQVFDKDHKTKNPQHTVNPGCKYDLAPALEELCRNVTAKAELQYVKMHVDANSMNGVQRVYGSLQCCTDHVATDQHPEPKLHGIQDPHMLLDLFCFKADRLIREKDLEDTEVRAHSATLLYYVVTSIP